MTWSISTPSVLPSDLKACLVFSYSGFQKAVLQITVECTYHNSAFLDNNSGTTRGDFMSSLPLKDLGLFFFF